MYTIVYACQYSNMGVAWSIPSNVVDWWVFWIWHHVWNVGDGANMRLLSHISTTVETIPVAAAGGQQYHVAGRRRVNQFEVLEEPGDHITQDEEFDAMFDGVYLYGVRALSCIHTERLMHCLPSVEITGSIRDVATPMSVRYGRVWKCIANGMRTVDPSTNIFSIRKTLDMERKQRMVADIQLYSQFGGYGLIGPNTTYGIVNLGCNT
jgi:hypothetical protein